MRFERGIDDGGFNCAACRIGCFDPVGQGWYAQNAIELLQRFHGGDGRKLGVPNLVPIMALKAFKYERTIFAGDIGAWEPFTVADLAVGSLDPDHDGIADLALFGAVREGFHEGDSESKDLE